MTQTQPHFYKSCHYFASSTPQPYVMWVTKYENFEKLSLEKVLEEIYLYNQKKNYK